MWGDDAYQKLGRGRNATSAPIVVKGLTGLQSVTAISAPTIAVVASGRITSWGGVRESTRPDGRIIPQPLSHPAVG